MFREGQQIGLYTLIRKLGQGGFGEVWLVEKENEFFAIKLPHKEQVDWKAITQEIGLWVLCGEHKNVLPLIGARNINGQIAIISEYAPDGSLEDLLREKSKLFVEEAVEMAIGILEGLQHLHESGIIHRDLKPANILLDGKIPRLADFGISSVMTADSSSQTVSGTLAYMSPEAFDGKRNVQTDIWAVGVILYQMLSGGLPFPQKEQTALIGAIIMREPEKMPLELDNEIKKVVSIALNKNPFERYKTVEEVLQDITAIRLYYKSKPYFIEALKHFEDFDNDVRTKLAFLIKSLTEDYNFSRETMVKMKPSILRFIREVESGKIIISTQESKSQNNNLSAKKLIPYRKGDKWGFSDINKNISIEPIYDLVTPFTEGMAGVRLNGKCGFLDVFGNIVISLKYDGVLEFKEGLAVAGLNGKRGIINKDEDLIVPCNFDSCFVLNKDLIKVGIKYKYGFFNSEGMQILDCKYNETTLLENGLIKLRLEDKFGCFDKRGNEVIPCKYDFIGDFQDGIALVKFKNKYGFIDEYGKEITACKYQEGNLNTYQFNEGWFVIT